MEGKNIFRKQNKKSHISLIDDDPHIQPGSSFGSPILNNQHQLVGSAAQMEATSKPLRQNVLSLQRHPLVRGKDWQHLLLSKGQVPMRRAFENDMLVLEPVKIQNGGKEF